MSKLKGTQDTLRGGVSVKEADNSNASELLMKNIVIPNSAFEAKWRKDEGYSVGIEQVRLSKDYETLEEALNVIGYGVDKDQDGDEILVKVGDIDYELVVRIVRALLIVKEENSNG